jgi:DNA polymerase III subunit chi
MQVDFYQLSRDPVDRVLPAIAAKVLANGGRLLVVAAEMDQREAISQGLWSTDPASFLAHDFVGVRNDAIQPILLSGECKSTNDARFIALADGAWRDEALTFDRVFYFFDHLTIDGARQSWRALRDKPDVEPRFWRQEGGKWMQGP